MRALGAIIPRLVNILRDLKSAMGPTQGLPCQGDFILAQWRTMATLSARFIGAALTNHGFAANQRRARGFRLRGSESCLNRCGVVTIDFGNNLPTIGLEAFGGIIGEPTLDLAVDRNAVVVVDRDQLSKALRSRE